MGLHLRALSTSQISPCIYFDGPHCINPAWIDLPDGFPIFSAELSLNFSPNYQLGSYPSTGGIQASTASRIGVSGRVSRFKYEDDHFPNKIPFPALAYHVIYRDV